SALAEPDAMDFTVSPLTAERWPALEELLRRARASNGCWCVYWRIGPGYRDRPRADNKRDPQRLAGGGRPPGLPAFGGGLGVGWCELAPRAGLGWLPLPGICGRWMTCRCGRSRVSSCGARTAITH